MMTLTRICRRALDLLAADPALTVAQALRQAHLEIAPETIITPETEPETETK